MPYGSEIYFVCAAPWNTSSKNSGGYAFASWSGAYNTSSNCVSGNLTTVYNNTRLYANFNYIKNKTLTINEIPAPASSNWAACVGGSGFYECAGPSKGASGSNTSTVSIPVGSKITYICAANWLGGGNYSFVSYGGAYVSQAGCDRATSIYVNSSTTINAEYSLPSPANEILTVYSNPNYAGSASGAGAYTHGEYVQISAKPAVGYLFTGWSCTGANCNNSTQQTAFIQMNNSATETANFQGTASQLTAASSPSNGGTVSGSGAYPYNTTAK